MRAKHYFALLNEAETARRARQAAGPAYRRSLPRGLPEAHRIIAELRSQLRQTSESLIDAHDALARREARRPTGEPAYVPARLTDPYLPDARGRRIREDTCYLIECEVTGRLKIGRSERPLERLAALRTGGATPLRLVATMRNTAGRLEVELHRRFADLRIRGEWFTPCPEIFAAFGVSA